MLKDLKVTKTTIPRAKPDQNNLGFGNYFTDHMFLIDYTEGKGWHDPRIVPYGTLNLEPSAMVFHYGQAIFEGMKAYRTEDGSINLFRPYENAKRINISGERLSIPALDPDIQVAAIKALVDIDRDWVPSAEGTSLYIRPFVISCDPQLGVRPSDTYLYIVILSPVGAYYPEGIDPVKIYIEDDYVRSVRGGTGFTKCAGNYAASLNAQVKAKKMNYTQVLWLDGVERKYIEEVGTMNVFFKIDGEIVTPALEGSILSGITRKSSIDLLRSWGYTVNERRISIDELYAAAEKGKLEEAFGTGTAAVISPIGELNWENKIAVINNSEIGPCAQKLYDQLIGIQYGTVADTLGWIEKV